MPIYEYQALDVRKACHRCRRSFETLQGLHEEPLTKCPLCGGDVRKVISWCRAAVAETSGESTRVERRIKEYETSGMWSHAAELADKHSEKVKDKNLKIRALDNYKKAGYDVNFLSQHANLNNE